MAQAGIFRTFASKVLLHGLPANTREAFLSREQTRQAIAFRFAYIFASHGPVLVPLLEALSGHVTLRWAMLALGVGSFTMMVAEVPGGIYADRAGPKQALRRGLILMITAMAGFFILGMARSLSLESSPPGTTWWPGVICMFGLEVVMGVALALIHGADTVFFVSVLRTEKSAGLDDEAIEGTGSAIRYYGTMIAVGLGATIFALAEVFALSPAVRIRIQSVLFLLTFAAQTVALVLLLRIDVPTPGSQQRRTPVTWSSLAQAYRELARRPELFWLLWIYAWTIACALMTVYLFQSPLKSSGLNLVQESPLFIPLFTGIMILGWWISASGSLLFRSTVARGPAQQSMQRQALAAVACVLVVVLLTVYPLAVFLTSEQTTSRAWAVLVAATMGFLLSNLLRGFFEPLARTTLLRFAREGPYDIPTSLISAFNIAQRAANFVGAIVFALLLPYVGSENLSGDQIGQRQDFIARALMYTFVVIGLIILVGIVLSQIYAHSQSRRRHPRCVVVGSYREDYPGLQDFCGKLRDLGLDVLHPPAQAVIVGDDGGFVRCNTDTSQDEGVVQRQVFHIIDQADLLIVYNPGGRIGTSAALEIGYALRAGKPIYTQNEPSDRTLLRLTSRWSDWEGPGDWPTKPEAGNMEQG